MCMTEIENRDSLTDKPRETNWTRLADKRVNYEMDRWTTRTFKHLLKIIKISHIPLYIYTHSVEVPSDLLKTLQSIENNL
jgi:hypothetical protein